MIKFLSIFYRQGYYNNPEATANVIDSEGFLKTGDIGYFNEDQSLMLIDRKKEVFKYNGYPINPSEIEETIQSIPGVEQVTVVGIPHPEFINLAWAAVVRQAGFEHLSEQHIVDHVAQKLAVYKHLHGGVLFMDSLPMTVSGKVLKRVIRETLTK
jgi:4-coumarate--CoA ligase